MKIVIIGGGVAGMAFSIMMQKKGHDVVVNEKGGSIPLGGNAFMMHEEGMSVLAEILGNESLIPGNLIDTFILKRPDDSESMHTKMEAWQCIKRMDLINALLSVIDKKTIRYNRNFSHFIYDRGKAIAAVFENGEVEIGDIFIGADGCNSQVRQLLFGETNFTKVDVREILGVVKNPELAKKLNGVFTKYQHPEKGISFGCIPFSENEVIWFNQFDVSLTPKPLITKKDFQQFTKEILKDFPAFVHTILDETDFSHSYLWNTKDFDALTTFHSENIVLIGDAAHISLPFTSAGTTNALFDAKQLAFEMEENLDLNKVFISFYNARIESIKDHIDLGRKLKTSFLYPMMNAKNDIEIPLIKTAVKITPEKITDNKLEILYFTDPICSTCWTIQPQLRRLKHNYTDSLKIKYVMGGLLPSWEKFDRGGIQKPSDVVGHWNDVSMESGMPIDSSVWLNEPLESSYPSSIAFKAAQMQNTDRAIIFLRRMNELVFMESKNISNVEVIKKAALETGLNVPKLLNDIKNNAARLFYEDLEYSKKLGIDTLPTFLFKVNGIDTQFLYGAQTYHTFEETILKHAPHLPKSPPLATPMDVFIGYPSITKHEFKYLTDSNDKIADKLLDDLLRFGMIKKQNTPAGSIFLSNTKNRAFLA